MVELLLELGAQIALDALQPRDVEGVVLAGEDSSVHAVDGLPLLLEFGVLRSAALDVPLNEVRNTYLSLQVVV